VSDHLVGDAGSGGVLGWNHLRASSNREMADGLAQKPNHECGVGICRLDSQYRIAGWDRPLQTESEEKGRLVEDWKEVWNVNTGVSEPSERKSELCLL